MLISVKYAPESGYGLCPMTGGVLIKFWRDEVGLTQTELAVRAGVSLSIIQKIEAGHESERTTLRSIVEAMDKTLRDYDAMAGKAAIFVHRDVAERFNKFATELELQGRDSDALAWLLDYGAEKALTARRNDLKAKHVDRAHHEMMNSGKPSRILENENPPPGPRTMARQGKGKKRDEGQAES